MDRRSAELRGKHADSALARTRAEPRSVEVTEDLAPGHHLLPPERRFASYILERQRTHRTAAILRMEQNYGPEGIVLRSAAMVWGLLAAVVGFTGVGILFAAPDHGLLFHSGYFVIAIGVVLALLSIFRSIQGTYAGRRFRAGRPFVKR